MKIRKNLVVVALAGLGLALGGCDFGSSDKQACSGPNCGQTDPGEVGFEGDDEEIENPIDETDPTDPTDPAKMDKLVNADLTVPHAIGLWDDSGEVVEGNLTDEEKAKIDLLRDTIYQGLNVGHERFIETVSLTLAGSGIYGDYETVVGQEGFEDDLATVPEACPFVKFYDNGFEPTGVACEYLVDQAKVEVYSELTQTLEDIELSPKVGSSNLVTHEEARFWLEQGAISGIEENRVLVRGDIKKRGLCSEKPTPIESSYDKGNIIGRQLFAEHFNGWLKDHGYVADYPLMSNPIRVCNADQTMLEPAHKAALGAVGQKAVAEPLCKDYEPTNGDDTLKYAQAKLDYAKGLKNGINDEFAKAAVKVFKVIPCNVGDPIVVDLDGDGIELRPIHKGVNFDLWGTETPHAMSWVGADDGFLVRDLNNDGRISSGAELFGNVNDGFADGFAQLAVMDTNANGRIDAGDKGFASLRIWKDSNSNGKTEAGELLSLASVKLVSIPLNAEERRVVIEGNVVPKMVWVEINGKKAAVGDAFLRTAPYASISFAR
jgi:hypothetical protein